MATETHYLHQQASHPYKGGRFRPETARTQAERFPQLMRERARRGLHGIPTKLLPTQRGICVDCGRPKAAHSKF